jgi:Ca-activated chloride channel homolog
VRRVIGKQRSVRAVMAAALVCALLSSLGVAVSNGQDGAVSPTTGSVYKSTATIRVHSDLVLIPVTVTDGKGKVVSGLEKEHFSLYEDAVQQEITHFATEDAPASIGLVFDASDSMGPKMRKAREAVSALLNKAFTEDEFFLIQFSTRPTLVVPLTVQPELIRERVERMQVGGSTALLDATSQALAEMRQAHHRRKAIVIISDGDDNSSICSMGELKEKVREADTVIYAIGIIDPMFYSQVWPPPQRPAGSALLREIAKQTGGRSFEVTNLKQLPEIATKIGALMRSQYLLGYAPNTPENNRAYRHVQVKVERPKGFPKLHAVWRLGYYPPKE